jgi:hypothetical protein
MGEPMHLAPALLNEFFKETYYPSQAVVYYDLACVLEPNLMVSFYIIIDHNYMVAKVRKGSCSRKFIHDSLSISATKIAS